MRKRVYRSFVGDFETTVYSGQEYTEVWLSGFCELWTETPYVQTSMEDFFQDLYSLKCNCKIYFHNLKFDGAFILDYLKKRPDYHERLWQDDSGEHWEKNYRLHHKDYIYQISDKGVFYSITINYRNYLYIFYDSLKIIPFSVAAIGKAFATKHQKLHMQYEGERKSGGIVTPEEKEYLCNDLYVVKEALEQMFAQGLSKQTIGSSALSVFRRDYDDDLFNTLFPNLYDIPLDPEIYGQPNIGEYIHKSYHGGWCYCNPKFKDTIQYHGCTVDANSLYPSRMRLERYPIGVPKFFRGQIPPEALQEETLFFIRFTCRFCIKEDHLPFVQIKNDLRFNGREMLTTNRVCSKYGDVISDDPVTFTMTQVDYYLFLDHYDTYDMVIHDGCYFKSVYHLFDKYVDSFMEMKMNARNSVERTIAKLLLNNLYGKFAMYIDSSFKVAYVKENRIAFRTVPEYDKTPTYIPIGSYITSYARNTTIRLAQRNIHHFCYADTDSLHCNCPPSDLVAVPIDDKKLGYWKLEMEWERGIFHRPKSYVESDLIDGVEHYHVTCAGMGKVPKQMFVNALRYRDGSMTAQEATDIPDLDDAQKDWILQGADITDFKTGLEIFGNLKARRIIGGIVLQKSPFVLRG